MLMAERPCLTLERAMPCVVAAQEASSAETRSAAAVCSCMTLEQTTTKLVAYSDHHNWLTSTGSGHKHRRQLQHRRQHRRRLQAQLAAASTGGDRKHRRLLQHRRQQQSQLLQVQATAAQAAAAAKKVATKLAFTSTGSSCSTGRGYSTGRSSCISLCCSRMCCSRRLCLQPGATCAAATFFAAPAT